MRSPGTECFVEIIFEGIVKHSKLFTSLFDEKAIPIHFSPKCYTDPSLRKKSSFMDL